MKAVATFKLSKIYGKSSSFSDSEEENNKLRRVDKRTKESGPVPLYLTVKHKEEGQTQSKTSPSLLTKLL